MMPDRWTSNDLRTTADDWSAFAARCQKPDHQRLGSWMARKLSRPAALRITWLIAPWQVSAHAVTLLAWAVAMAAAAAMGLGSVAGWVAAVALWQVWYLLDHVDGQLARWRSAVSLDGAQLDYLMHHAVQLTLPASVGWGLFQRHSEPAWLLVGAVWGLARLLNGLLEDTKFKAFEQRWKRLIGTLELAGGAGGRPIAHDPPQASRVLQLAWGLRKLGEPHVAMNLLTLLALTAVVVENAAWKMLGGYAAIMAVLSTMFFTRDLHRGLRQQRVERSFAQWFQPPAGHDVVYLDGWWRVVSRQSGEGSETASSREVG